MGIRCIRCCLECTQRTSTLSKALNCGPSSKRSHLCPSPLCYLRRLQNRCGWSSQGSSLDIFNQEEIPPALGLLSFRPWMRASPLEDVVWVPAHISESRIGDVSCGDGTPITKHMWLGNKLVDELAKRGAHTIKAPQDVVRSVVARQLQAQELAGHLLGQVTALANARDNVALAVESAMSVVLVLLRLLLWRRWERERYRVAQTSAYSFADGCSCSKP